MLTGAQPWFSLCVQGGFTAFCKCSDLFLLKLTGMDTWLQCWMCLSLGIQLEEMGC